MTDLIKLIPRFIFFFFYHRQGWINVRSNINISIFLAKLQKEKDRGELNEDEMMKLNYKSYSSQPFLVYVPSWLAFSTRGNLVLICETCCVDNKEEKWQVSSLSMFAMFCNATYKRQEDSSEIQLKWKEFVMSGLEMTVPFGFDFDIRCLFRLDVFSRGKKFLRDKNNLH